MPSAKPALQGEAIIDVTQKLTPQHASATVRGPRRLSPLESAPSPNVHPLPTAAPGQPHRDRSFQPRVPVITGEVTYRGLIPVDGIISGQLGATGSALIIKQRPSKAATAESVPELNGEITFKDMLRVNGHIAGKVFSYRGTLIVDASARVDAEIDVEVCLISGIVSGDIVAHKRVELGAGAEIYGNIATRSINMKPGAVFHGDCRMLKDEDANA